MALGWIPPVLNQLKNAKSGLSLTDEELAWMPTLYYIARGIGPVFTALFIDRLGRNRVLMFIAWTNLSTWVIILSTRTVIWLYLSRLLLGVAVGVEDNSVSIYIGENSSPKFRGTFAAIANLFFYAGELIAFILATYLSYNNVAFVHGGLGLLTVLSTMLLKEPAQFLIMKGKLKEAERNYCWLRGLEEDAKLEFEAIKQNIFEGKSKTTFIQCYRSFAVRKSLRIVVIMMFLVMSTGFAPISSFITMTFTTSGQLTSNEFTILYGLLQLISCCISSCIIEKFNRRTLLLLTCAIIIISQVGSIILYSVRQNWYFPFFDWLLFATLTTYSCIFGMLVFPLTAAIRGELLPQNVKALGNSAATIASSISAFISAKVFLSIANEYGMETNFILFSTMSLILFIYVSFDLPETRGKSLVEIQKELEER